MLSVSIVIPAYNESENIVRCLEACLIQTVPPNEIVVVNNLSNDNTVDLVKQFSAEHPGITLKMVEQSEYQSRQPTIWKGLNSATSDILGRIDADTVVEKHWVENVQKGFENDDNIGGLTGPVAYYDMPFSTGSLRADKISRSINSLFMKEYPFLFGSNMALRRTAWEKIRGEVCKDLTNGMHEDIDLALHLKFNEYEIIYDHHLVAFISARRIENSLKDFRDYTKLFSKTYKAHGIKKASLKFPEYYLMAIYFPLHALRKFYHGSVDANLAKLDSKNLKV
jgi:cellulose synthase/poly-beta-1,6-N-acetylglucosamine synthase-like glycosyltransferase